MPDVVMPRLSDSMEEGTILKWLKASGDEVHRGEELVEIETDKATMTYEADMAGPLEILASEGDTLPIGAVIARIPERRRERDDGAGRERAQRRTGRPVRRERPDGESRSVVRRTRSRRPRRSSGRLRRRPPADPSPASTAAGARRASVAVRDRRPHPLRRPDTGMTEPASRLHRWRAGSRVSSERGASLGARHGSGRAHREGRRTGRRRSRA